jgi:hypothetical protein
MMLAVGLFLLLSGVSFFIPNHSVDYCTTKGYGFPLLWKVEHCLCEQEKVEHHPLNAAGNLLMSAAAATAVALIRKNRVKSG